MPRKPYYPPRLPSVVDRAIDDTTCTALTLLSVIRMLYIVYVIYIIDRIDPPHLGVSLMTRPSMGKAADRDGLYLGVPYRTSKLHHR
jgi:hypothetical protein